MENGKKLLEKSKNETKISFEGVDRELQNWEQSS